MEASNSARVSPVRVHGQECSSSQNWQRWNSHSELPFIETKIEPVKDADSSTAIPDSATESSNTIQNVGSSSSSSDHQCRICFSGKDGGPLIHACRCIGSIGFAHEHCLSRWIQEKGTDRCEICSTTYQYTRTLRNAFEWTFPVTICRPSVYRGVFLSAVIWLFVYYFVIITVKPQNFVMKEVFFCIMYTLLMILFVMTVIIFRGACQSLIYTIRQWYAINSRSVFVEQV